ncbi:MAG: Hsp70 family protein [Desulfobacteraceae bacterium]|nr:MAG: Hsp70 family protein [Desulfobacteraceae bacterium]
MSDPAYIIGIDLGTTNTVVAYTATEGLKKSPPEIHVFDIPQVVSEGVVETRNHLPSFILIPQEHQVSRESLHLPWKKEERFCLGEFARERGKELPDHLISSSKSWLCHEIVDRSKAILPWNSHKDHFKMSPIEASSKILEHIRDAWNHTMAHSDHRCRIEEQEIFLTVPASFDAMARELTVKAAQMAGLSNFTLLEEPQAAFYAWIQSNGDRWRDVVRKGDLIIVCDIGGGTSDFSLIRVSEQQGELVLERIAVGDHLLVGGDNMDLALAYTVANKLSGTGKKIDAWQMRGLMHSCRIAKEKLLSENGPESCPISILGRGSSLIGNTIKTSLDREEVIKVLVDGFFPFCEKSDRPVGNRKIGLQEQGLSFEADPGVTRHLAKFLSGNANDPMNTRFPTAVLFNGGIMKSDSIRKRILNILSAWKQQESDGSGKTETTRELQSHDFDLSVAKGAAYYGLAGRGEGVRIRGGLGRSYYIGIAASMPAVPGMPAPMKALCVAPFGTEEGSLIRIEDQEFVTMMGEPIQFDLLGSSVRKEDQAGMMIEDWNDGEIVPVAAIETVLEGDHGKSLPVFVEIEISEIGTLSFRCVSREDGRKWKFEFNVREKENLAV